MPAKKPRARLTSPDPPATRKPGKKRVPSAKAAAQAKRDELATEREAKGYKYAQVKVRSNLDDDLLELICEQLALGNTLTNIAAMLCILPKSLTEWRRHGEAYNGGEHHGHPEWEICGVFVIAARMAIGEYKCGLDVKIHKSKDWFRYLQIASRKDPQNYGKDPRGGSPDDYDPDESFL